VFLEIISVRFFANVRIILNEWKLKMRKPLKFYNKLISVILFMVLPGLGLANELLDQHLKQEALINNLFSYQSYIDNMNTLELFNNSEDYVEINSLSIGNKPIPKGKPELEKILGTWILSYTIEGTTFTDRLELDGVLRADDGSFFAHGNLFLNNTGEGLIFVCSDIFAELSAPLESDFICNGETQNFGAYTFRVSGDNITSGYYGFGNTREELVIILNTKIISLSGHRENTNENSSDSYYDEVAGELVIPIVNYQASNYRVILKNMGDFIFSIKEAQPTSIEVNGSVAVYDEINNELIIPVVSYQGSKYRVVLENTGDFIFSIKQAQPAN
jgi:hypothetical protein